MENQPNIDPIDRLARFTPSLGSLNRDELLFRAGQASLRPRSFFWKWLALGLALTQLITIALAVFLRPATPAAPVAPDPIPTLAPAVADPPANTTPVPDNPATETLPTLRMARLLDLDDRRQSSISISDVATRPVLRLTDLAAAGAFP